ncbi:hypothetical protein [Candidatus Methylomicrobium oryzae]|uniref:hypothetical protein n=1 Tax=Candidatus Methylomicrobium oryzae TaxID=2802053 RepID=UPI0019219D09|nr:hypothetical protein [Methylomicrobium sp. RS1]MBL1265820.1 hypothetical protein [Methylomicrobium sp. RS1]
MKFEKIAISLCLLATLPACSQRMVDFTVISSKNVDISRGADLKRLPTRIKGEDRKSIIIVIPTGIPNAKEAMDNAIESVPGAVALVDGVITQHSWYIPYIFGQTWIEVEGTPLIDPLYKQAYQSSAN